MITGKSLREFRENYKSIKLAPFVNSNTGESFKSLAFIGFDDKVTLVGFSSKLGELTAQEIKAQADELRVVQLESGSLKLCRAGESSWEDVDI